jgi:hypothetical protein
MSSHRYWRLIGLEPYGAAALELSEVALIDAGTLVSGALTSNVSPTSGSVSDLYDGSTSGLVSWAAAAGLVLHWDLGSATEVNNIQLGSGADKIKFLLNAVLQWSDDDSTWTAFDAYSGISWPGVRTLTSVTAFSAFRFFRLLITDWIFNGVANSLIAGDVRVLELSYMVGATRYPTVAMTGASAPSPLVATASNFFTGSDPYKAFNRVETSLDTTGWQSSGVAGKWLTIDLGNGNAILPDGLRWVADGSITTNSGYYSTGFRVYGSNTGAFAGEETLMLAVSGLAQSDWANYTAKTFSIPSNRIPTNRVQGKVSAVGMVSIPSQVSSMLNTPTGTTRKVEIARGRNDYVTGVLGEGVGRVKGTTKDKGSPNVPVSERVRLYRMIDGALIREVWSTPGTGAFSFDYIDELQTYYVIAFDHDNAFRAVVADNLTLSNGGVELIP